MHRSSNVTFADGWDLHPSVRRNQKISKCCSHPNHQRTRMKLLFPCASSQRLCPLSRGTLEAAQRIHSHVLVTPVEPSAWLMGHAEGQSQVHLKLESEQRTGSFKVRGAVNKVSARMKRRSIQSVRSQLAFRRPWCIFPTLSR